MTRNSGTSVGTQVFVKYGWRPAAALALGWMGLQLVLLLLRGPHCSRYTWFGYEGGMEARKVIEEETQMGQNAALASSNRSTGDGEVGSDKAGGQEPCPERDKS